MIRRLSLMFCCLLVISTQLSAGPGPGGPRWQAGTGNQAPVINNQIMAIDENSAAGTWVGVVSASDPDGDAITFAITAGNTDGAFTIISGSGRLDVANPLAMDFEAYPSFDLTIRVTDNGGLSDSAVVTVSLNDLVETDPPIIETPLPIEPSDAAFWSTHFAGSDNCGSCHNGLRDENNTDVSIETDWSTSMMANSTRDPFWRAKVASEIKRNPLLEEVINDKCFRCHAPMAHVEAGQDSDLPTTLREGFLNPANPYYDLGMNGVSCTLCHQIDDTTALGTEAGFSGKFSIVDLGQNVSRTAFGQYTDPRTNPMLMNSGFQPSWGGHMSDSALCASCHNLKTPFVDAEGNLAATEFPEQMVYSEWENSAFAGTEDTCQNCHMPKTDGVKIANRPSFLNARNDFSRHTLLGANSAMLDIMANNRETLGITATGFDKAIAGTRAMLATAASLEMTTSQANGGIEVVLTVNNESGHKFPTSFPSRRAFIHLVVRDSSGSPVWESGAMNPDGSIVGVDADTHTCGVAYSYEPHYDEITSEEQVQVYEPIMGNTDGDVTYTLLRAAQYLKDNRIPPLGFDKVSVADDIAVKGAALNDGDFNNGSDTVKYQIAVPATGNYTVEAELRFQTLAYGFIQDLFCDETNPEVALFKQLYDSASLRAETIDSVVRGIAVQ